MEAAFEELRAFVRDGTGAASEASEVDARRIVLASLDASLDDADGETSDFALIGSMLLLRHQGLPTRSWAETAHALARVLPRPDAAAQERQ